MKWKVKTAMLTAAAVLFASAVPAMAAAPQIEHVDYKGKGRVEVEFAKDVTYKQVKVTVKDQDGKSYKAIVQDKDSDDITFWIQNFACAKKYTYKIRGIKNKKEGSYANVSGSVRIPAAKTIKIKKICYDASDKEVEFKFKTRVAWKEAKVTLTDENGNKIRAKITDKDSDELELKTGRLKKGESYRYQISGIRNIDAKSYRTLKGSFVA